MASVVRPLSTTWIALTSLLPCGFTEFDYHACLDVFADSWDLILLNLNDCLSKIWATLSDWPISLTYLLSNSREISSDAWICTCYGKSPFMVLQRVQNTQDKHEADSHCWPVETRTKENAVNRLISRSGVPPCGYHSSSHHFSRSTNSLYISRFRLDECSISVSAKVQSFPFDTMISRRPIRGFAILSYGSRPSCKFTLRSSVILLITHLSHSFQNVSF